MSLNRMAGTFDAGQEYNGNISSHRTADRNPIPVIIGLVRSQRGGNHLRHSYGMFISSIEPFVRRKGHVFIKATRCKPNELITYPSFDYENNQRH